MRDGVIRLGRRGDSRPVLAAAVHDGSVVRPELEAVMALSREERRREEDPFTGDWAGMAPWSLVGVRSRFEFDLNRPRETAVYQDPGDSWGLQVWRKPLDTEQVETSLAAYDRFYEVARAQLESVSWRHGRFVVLDLHSYNHRRDGPEAPAAPAERNPEINIGTGSVDRTRWGHVVDATIAHFSSLGFDIRENVKFVGRQFPQWVHREFPRTGCCLALEFKKTFMDEWTGELDSSRHQRIAEAISSLVDLLDDLLRRSATHA
ncbi:MAG: N-formylglutamate amidohydrolase [Planctomycetota bacterium]|jgi:N-formylglutamate amidohydrolase